MDRGTIQGFWLRCKGAVDSLLADWGVILIIFLAAFSSFGLGRLSVAESARPPVTVGMATEEGARGMAVGGLVVASRSGTAYHYPWCPGASQIKEENKIWFASEEAATKAGYAPSKNCKGLGSE